MKQIALLSLSALWLAISARAESTRPNFILLMLDDLDVATFREVIRSGYAPNLKRYFVDEGLEFTNSFVSDPVCCPSRATELTGKYTHNHGVLTVSRGISYAFGPGGIPVVESSTRATWLRSAGYYTGHVGKYLNGYGIYTAPTYVPPGYDEWYGLVDPFTYRVYNYRINENGVVRKYGSTAAEYQTDVLAAKALGFLRNHRARAGNRPFFLALTPLAPHIEVKVIDVFRNANQGYSSHFKETIRPAPRHEHLADFVLANGEMPEPPSLSKGNFNEVDVSDKIAMLRQIPQLTNEDLQFMRRQWKQRLASIVAVDEMVGLLAQELMNTGRWNNTYIFLTTDNGYFFGEHRLSSKLWPYEESIRVPLLVRGPGVPQGTKSAALVINNDLAPTYADLAGVAPGHTVDGRSLKALLVNPAASWSRKQVLVQLFQEQGFGRDFFPQSALAEIGTDLSVPTYKALRCLGGGRNEIYLRWYESTKTDSITDPRNPGTPTAYEYYDLATDPLQLTNQAPSLTPVKLSDLERRLTALQSCAGSSCRSAEDQP